jgi:N-acetylglutamate synthase-like GNAT family acetyltransferase
VVAGFRIREASENDIPVLVALVNRSFEIEKYFSGGDRTDAGEMRSMMQRGIFLVCEDEQAATGCVYVEIKGDAGYFGMLAVDPRRQKSGLGARLTSAAEDFARRHGCSVMDITVVSLRTALFPHYRKLGYEEVGPEPPRKAKREPLIPYQLVRMRKRL